MKRIPENEADLKKIVYEQIAATAEANLHRLNMNNPGYADYTESLVKLVNLARELEGSSTTP